MGRIHDHFSLLTQFAMAIGLAVILPKLMERIRLPAVLGFIIAGVIIGPSVLDMVDPEGPVINMRAEIGKLLFMFFVGFEIDLDEFKRSRSRSLFFGALTFLLPFVGGVALGRLRGAGWNSAMLIGSLISSHTLLAFPILRRLGLAHHPSVLMVVGGTIFTDIASMLVLAVTASVHLAGFSWSFLAKELLELAVFVVLVFYGAGSLARKAIVRYGQTRELRMMILLFVIALCAEGAEAIKLEGIVGAFLVGIAVKRAVRGKFAVEQLEVTAHAIFIPAFFLTAGFLVNFPLLWQTALTRPGLVVGLFGVLVSGKYLAAWLSGRAFGSSRTETALVWSISLPQMAATLATAVVAHHTVNSSGEPLLDGSYVNAVLLLVVTTCVAGPILSERFASRLQADANRNRDANESFKPCGAPS